MSERLLDMLIPLGLSRFHVAVTVLALYRARRAVRLAAGERKADRRTLWRLAALRIVAAVVILSGGVLAVCTPMFVALRWSFALLPTTIVGIGVMIVTAWPVWIVSTVALDNLALRWLKRRAAAGQG